MEIDLRGRLPARLNDPIIQQVKSFIQFLIYFSLIRPCVLKGRDQLNLHIEICVLTQNKT